VLIGAAEKADYTGGMKEYLVEQFAALSTTAGINNAVPIAFLDEYLTDDVARFPIEKIFSEEKDSLDFTGAKELLLARITDYAQGLRESREIEMSREEWEQVFASFDTLCDYYISEVKTAILLRGIYGTIGALISQINAMMPLVLSVSAFLALASILLIGKIGGCRGLLLSLYAALGAGGILYATFPAIIYIKKIPQRIGLDPPYFKSLIRAILEGFLRNALYVGMAMLLGALICGVIYLLKKKKGDIHDQKLQNEKAEG